MCWPAVSIWALAAGASGQQRVSFGSAAESRGVAVAAWCRCAAGVLHAAGMSVQRGRGAAARQPRRRGAPCVSRGASPAQCGRAAKQTGACWRRKARRPGAATGLGAADGGQRWPSGGHGVQAVMGDCGRPAGGRPCRSGSWQRPGSDLRWLLAVSTNRCALGPWPRRSPTRCWSTVRCRRPGQRPYCPFRCASLN
jgi:hypothetical protein